jgi:hypothetical protein
MNFKKNPAKDFKDLDAMDKNEARREIKALQEGIEHHETTVTMGGTSW